MAIAHWFLHSYIHRSAIIITNELKIIIIMFRGPCFWFLLAIVVVVIIIVLGLGFMDLDLSAGRIGWRRAFQRERRRVEYRFAFRFRRSVRVGLLSLIDQLLFSLNSGNWSSCFTASLADAQRHLSCFCKGIIKRVV